MTEEVGRGGSRPDHPHPDAPAAPRRPEADHDAGWGRGAGAEAEPRRYVDQVVGVRFYDANANRASFGTPDRPGPIYETARTAIDVWTSVGLLEVELTPADMISYEVWE